MFIIKAFLWIKTLIVKIIVWFESLIMLIIPHNVVVIDTETTGVDSDDEILQLSMVSGYGRVLFNKYIKPEQHTEWKGAQKVNHISPLKVMFCCPISVYEPLINAILKRTKTVVGYNTQFDLGQLSNAGITTDADAVDVMREDAERRGNARWRKLYKTAFSYGYIFAPHDALEDCMATLHIYKRMFPEKNLLRIVLNIINYVLPIALYYYIAINCISSKENYFWIYLLFPAVCYMYGTVRGVATGVLFALITSGTNPYMIITYALLGLALSLLYKASGLVKYIVLHIVFVAILTAIGVHIAQIPVNLLMGTGWNSWYISEEMVEYMVAGAPLYVLFKCYVRRFI